MLTEHMGGFRVDIEVEHPGTPGVRLEVRSVLIDTGAEITSLPATVLQQLGIRPYREMRFRQADGSAFTRPIGGVKIHLGGTATFDDVVFGEPGDIVLLGARSMEGLNLEIDVVGKTLRDRGPMLMAANCRSLAMVGMTVLVSGA